MPSSISTACVKDPVKAGLTTSAAACVRGAELAEVEPIGISFTGALDVLIARPPENKKAASNANNGFVIGSTRPRGRSCGLGSIESTPAKSKNADKPDPPCGTEPDFSPKPNRRFQDHLKVSI